MLFRSYMGEHSAVEVKRNIWKPFPMCESLPILVNIKAGATSWPWSSEPVAAAGRCRGAPRQINFQKFRKKIKKTFVKVLPKNVVQSLAK